MTPEQKQRIEQIQENRRIWYGGQGQVTADIDFLLSLVKSQEAPLKSAHDLAVEWSQSTEDGSIISVEEINRLALVIDSVATSMRSACVEKVKALRAEWLELANKQPGWCQHVRAADSIITALESVSIQGRQNSEPRD